MRERAMRQAILRVTLALLLATLVWVLTAEFIAPALRTSHTASPPTDGASAAQIAKGAYLARIGNCAQCHTAAGGPPYAGGEALHTPFGKVYGSNLTPHPQAGIGLWSPDDFWRAMHEGLRPDGRALNPAFPYTSFTHLHRNDTDALFAYLRTLPPADNPSQAHALPWPLGSQTALLAWRALHFRVAHTSPSESVPPSELRGAYLVQGLGHCAECHTPRNALGGLRQSAPWQGALMPDGLWYAPSLNDPREAGLSQWQTADIATLLTHGQHGQAFTAGPMAEVVRNSTQFLTPEDATSMALYLRTLSRSPVDAAPAPATAAYQTPKDYVLGERLYEKHCAECHGKSGEGVENAYPALAGNRAVLMNNSHNLIQALLRGGYGPSTLGKPQPHGMPPFQLNFSDAEVAAVLSFIRSAWGQYAPPLSEFEVNKIRNMTAR
jgi:mono/diheme cytochrome c family protein